MNTAGSDTAQQSSIDAERCIAELQRGRAVVLTRKVPDTRDLEASVEAAKGFHIIHLVETLGDQELEALMDKHSCQLVLSRSRAHAIGLMVDSSAVCLELEPHTTVETLRDWSGLNPASDVCHSEQAASRLGGTWKSDDQECAQQTQIATNKLHCARAALNLAHHAHVLPAFIMYSQAEKPEHLLSVDASAASQHGDQTGELITLSKARIPLASAESVELTVFRERHGNAEHVAVKVGDPDLSKAVTVRIHSSCFTGDILGSMKCDCGEQLQGAIDMMAKNDGGVIIYVSQEGRGIGLSSKLLAYQLQDEGLDTIEANQHLGFESDERRYEAAVFMLGELGVGSLKLMTNNPLKIEALKKHGIDVQARVPSPATVNSHNAKYLQTKRDRAGHLTS